MEEALNSSGHEALSRTGLTPSQWTELVSTPVMEPTVEKRRDTRAALEQMAAGKGNTLHVSRDWSPESHKVEKDNVGNKTTDAS